MQLSSVDLNVLVALDALLSERSVTRAAKRVGLSQPGMSNALSRLRRMFDDQLLIREGATLTLTPRAESLAQPVREALALIQQALDDRLVFHPATDAATCTISCSDYSILMLIGPLVRHLRTRAPKVRIRVLPRSLDPVGLLRDGTADLVIEPTAVLSDTSLRNQPLFEDHWVCCVSADSLPDGDRMTAGEYRRRGHVVYSMGVGQPVSLADLQLEDLGVERKIDAVLENLLLAPYVLQGTDLVAIVPARAAPYLSRTADVRFVPAPFDLPILVESLWWHPRNDRDPVHIWLREQLAEVARDVASGSVPNP